MIGFFDGIGFAGSSIIHLQASITVLGILFMLVRAGIILKITAYNDGAPELATLVRGQMFFCQLQTDFLAARFERYGFPFPLKLPLHAFG